MNTSVVGIDVGSTFTEMVLCTPDGISLAKVPSHPEDLTKAIEPLTQQLNLDLATVAQFIVGSTVALNTVLEKKGAKTALVTTKGFRDILEIAEGRPTKIYGLQQDLFVPLIPRRFRRDVAERVDHLGEVLVPLDLAELHQVVAELVQEGIESVAVCFLFSFMNNKHELTAKEYIRDNFPGLDVSISSEVSGVIREYGRTSTTAINAYVSPKVKNYVNRTSKYLTEKGLPTPPLFAQSNGGAATADIVKDRSINLIWSGPAGGVIGAINLFPDYHDLITLDMGGTSCDISVVKEKMPTYSQEGEIAGYPFQTPAIDIVTLGAGGGSIAWIDAGGALRVGPRSAGSVPGPVCFDTGGEEPTVTDALVLTGVYPAELLGGKMRLNVQKAESALASLGSKLGASALEVATAIYQITSNSMAQAIRSTIVKKGLDPSGFTLIAFGGAGPGYAAYLAKEIGISRVAVPTLPGAFSALGLLTTDLQQDAANSYMCSLSAADVPKLNQLFQSLEESVVGLLQAQGLSRESIKVVKSADLRYLHQAYELTVPLPPKDYYGDVNLLSSCFNAAHREVFGHAFEGDEVELLTVRVRGVGRMPVKAEAKRIEKGDGSIEAAIKGKREVHIPGIGRRECLVLDRARLLAGSRLVGPAIIEEYSSTTILPPEMDASIDDYGHLIIDIKV